MTAPFSADMVREIFGPAVPDPGLLLWQRWLVAWALEGTAYSDPDPWWLTDPKVTW